MRPIERGPVPRTYARYADAIGDLEDRLGRYCSYCERRLPTSLAVEHVAPKSLHRDRERDWGNFLLACANCNSAKGNKDVTEDEFLWPDRHNTMLALAYSRDGLVQVAGGLTPELGQRARALIDLVGLDRPCSHLGQQPTKRDRRWTDREEAWSIAESCRDRFESLDRSMEARDPVLAAAKGCGFFSVWFAVFEGHVDVRLALIDAVPGTAASCFNEEADLIRRPGAEI